MLWWTDDLKTGIEIIDKQHKSIFDKANKIFNLGTSSSREEIEKIFIFLMNYTINHFSDEEKVMLDNHYDDFMKHREQHNYFVEQVYKIYYNFKGDKITDEALNELKMLIIEWLANHINKDDKDFIKTIR
ncbi:MAG: bacteriohemerythrin [Tissierellaceae bacterium]|nr:bacteriohemerythrin [Tissierellaceae bacterium]